MIREAATVLFLAAIALSLTVRADDAPSLLEIQRQYGEAENEINRQKARLEQGQEGINALQALQDVVKNFTFPATTQARADFQNAPPEQAPLSQLSAPLRRLFGAVDSDLRLLSDSLRKELNSRETGTSSVPGIVGVAPDLPSNLVRELDGTFMGIIEGNGEPRQKGATALAATDPAGLRSKLLNDLSKRVSTLESSVKDASSRLTDLQNRRKELDAQISKRQEGQLVIDQTLIKFALPSFAALVVMLLLAPRLYQSDRIQHTIIESGLLLELITVFLLTATTLILGISGRIDGDILGTLLGGISGFVLGRARLNAAARLPTKPDRTDNASSAGDA